MTKNTKVVKANNSKELAVELANFNLEIANYSNEKILVLSYDWINKETWNSWTKFKYYGILKEDTSRLDFLKFKALTEMAKQGSLAIFWKTGLIQTAISENLISEELS